MRELHLETSKTINIDVPPNDEVDNLPCLGYSETVTVNVPPTHIHTEADIHDIVDCYPDYEDPPIMMEKAEDVLRQRIRELEKLEKHLRHQVCDTDYK